MRGISVAGIGEGAIRGLETSRRHRQEDRRSERADELHGLRTQRLGLDIERGEHDLRHRQEMAPMERRQAEQGVEVGDMELEAQRRTRDTERALAQFAIGDVAGVQEWYNRYAPNNITEIGRRADGTFHLIYDDGDEEALTRDELGARMAIFSDPMSWIEEMRTEGGDGAHWRAMGDSALYHQQTGEVRGPDDLGLDAGPDMDQRDRKIADLMREGVDRATATDIVDGRKRIVQNPVTGASMLLNLRTQETEPLDFPSDEPNLLTEREEPGLLHEPLEVGMVPWIAEMASRTGGQFFSAWNNEDLERARTNLRMLREEFIEALAKSGRPPVVEQNRILESFPSLGPMESPARARASLQAVGDSLVKIRNDDLRYAVDDTAPSRARGEARERARAIDRMLRRLDPTLFEDDDQGIGSAGGAQDIGQMSIEELERLEPADLSEDELEAAARRWEEVHRGR